MQSPFLTRGETSGDILGVVGIDGTIKGLPTAVVETGDTFRDGNLYFLLEFLPVFLREGVNVGEDGQEFFF